MIIKWYNRDEFSDQDMAKAKSAADRLLGKKKPLWEDPRAPFFSGTQMQSPIMYGSTFTNKEKA